LASPIEAEDDRVGVVMVLLEEQSSEEYLCGLAEEVAEPTADAFAALQQMGAEMSEAFDVRRREIFERALQSVEQAQKSLRDLQVALRGGKPRPGRFDITGTVMRVAERVAQETDGETRVEILMSPNLPRVSGSAGPLERLLLQLIRQRLNEAREGQPLTILGRALGSGAGGGVMVSLVDVPDADRRDSTGLPPDAFAQGAQAMGGDVICVEDTNAGRVTSLRLPVAEA
jgi:hypothetical protein